MSFQVDDRDAFGVVQDAAVDVIGLMFSLRADVALPLARNVALHLAASLAETVVLEECDRTSLLARAQIECFRDELDTLLAEIDAHRTPTQARH